MGIKRTILVDDVDGSVHVPYGGLPNCLFVIGRGGIILYKSMWTTADRVEEFLRRIAGPLASPMWLPMYTEQAELRRADRKVFEERLVRNGQRSVDEWENAKRIWMERAKAARRSR